MIKYIALFVFVLGLTATTFAYPVNDPPCEMEIFTLGKVTLTAGTLIYLETNERFMTDQATVG